MLYWPIINGSKCNRVSFNVMKWNESGFSPLLFTYRLNWSRRTSWGWCDDTALQTQYSNPGGLRPSTLPLGHGGSPQHWVLGVDWDWEWIVSFKPPEPENEPRTHSVKGSGANHYPRAPALKCHGELLLRINPFVTSPGDLRDSGRPFRYEARRSPGLIAFMR